VNDLEQIRNEFLLRNDGWPADEWDYTEWEEMADYASSRGHDLSLLPLAQWINESYRK
jgi:hypothetical protein